MESFSISRGSSADGAITLQSERFKATATCADRDGIVSIAARTEQVHSPSRFVGASGNFVLFSLAWLSFSVLIRDAFLHRSAHAIEAQFFWKMGLWLFWIWSSVMGILLALRGVRGIAPWHGAEHKAIASYDRLGKIDYDDIKRQSPISDYCGARLFALVVIAGIFGGIAIPIQCLSAWSELAISILVLVLGAACDTMFLRIIGAIAFSRLLQRWTTAEPGEKELATAIAALNALIQAHEYPETVSAPQP